MRRINSYAELRESENPQEDCYWKAGDRFMLHLRGVGVGDLSKHSVTEHADGTITVTPSILVTGHNAGEPISRHGHITKGEWADA